jgi:hypothetical protein
MLEMPGSDEEDGGCSCPRCQPHPELVKAQRPTPVQVTEVAALFGAWPAGSYLSGDIVVGERP